MRKKTFNLLHIVQKAGAAQAEMLPPNQHRQMAMAPGTTTSSSATTTGWKSPVPYLFGGLAAMLGLIAFALLILACSYWKLSGSSDDDEFAENSGDGARDGEKAKKKSSGAFENSVLVIMAGEEKPTFLATPATTRTTSFGYSDGKPSFSCSCSCSSSSSDNGGGGDEESGVKLSNTTINSRESGGSENR